MFPNAIPVWPGMGRTLTTLAYHHSPAAAMDASTVMMLQKVRLAEA